MLGREKLETKELLNGDGFGYKKDEADKVMDAMESRIKELEATISILETTQKWISVKDRLPEVYREFDRFLVCCELYVDGKKRRYSTEGYLACGVNPFVFCDNDGRILDNAVMWCEMPLPPPPTTEDSSATEKENG